MEFNEPFDYLPTLRPLHRIRALMARGSALPKRQGTIARSVESINHESRPRLATDGESGLPESGTLCSHRQVDQYNCPQGKLVFITIMTLAILISGWFRIVAPLAATGRSPIKPIEP